VASITFAQFLYGEIGQESGGDYHAQSPAGALGKYQILSSNVPSWSKQILGYSIDAQTFLNNPKLQDAIAIGMLYKYFKAYGPEGAASAWYTGNPDAWTQSGGGDNYGGPSAHDYVTSVMSRAAGYNGNGSDLTYSGKPVANANQVGQLSVGVDAAGSGGGGATKSSGMTMADYASVDNLGDLLKQIPELRQLVNQAQKAGWSATEFENQVQNSHWWRNHSESARNSIIQRINDPSTWAQNVQKTINSIRQLSHQLGMPLSRDEAHGIAIHALMTGNFSNQQFLTGAISNHEDYGHLKNLNGLQGGMAATALQLKQMASDYGMNWTPAQIAERAQNVIDGTTTIDTYQNDLIGWAKSAFPGLAKQIDGGQTVRQLADPYVQSMSALLEIDPGTLSVYTPKIRQAMQGYQDPHTKERAPLSLSDFETQVRQDPRWQYTQNAKDTMSTALLKIGADFGFGPTG
jgi:hypothetical protein